jgi:hypothetical protein
MTVNGEALDLRLLREDIPPQVSGSSSRRAEHSAPRRATQATSAAGRRQDQQPRGGFRSDLPYGAGFEARQGRASATTLRGLGQGGGRGAGGGRGR